jgi:hypothetical protein
MLELPRLLIQPWAPPADTPTDTPARLIRDPESGRTVGFARVPSGGGWWWRWLTWPVLEVCESADASLLFTVHRLWALAPRWEVRDAEGRRLGVFDRSDLAPVGTASSWAFGGGHAGERASPASPSFHHGTARALVLQPVPGSFGQEVELPPLHQLVTVAEAAGGTAVTFAPGAMDNPFAKMLVLAAVLTAG